MLWLIIGDASYEIVSCNIHFKEGKYQVWVERPNGKTIKINESTNEEDIKTIKEAIDYAISKGEKTLSL